VQQAHAADAPSAAATAAATAAADAAAECITPVQNVTAIPSLRTTYALPYPDPLCPTQSGLAAPHHQASCCHISTLQTTSDLIPTKKRTSQFTGA
jgi:hypothetical protein